MSKSDKFVAVGLALILALLMRTCVMVEGATEKIPTLANPIPPIIEEFETMNEKVTTWKFYIIEGVKAEHVVRTTRNEGESNAEWTARHLAIVNSDKASFVPC